MTEKQTIVMHRPGTEGTKTVLASEEPAMRAQGWLRVGEMPPPGTPVPPTPPRKNPPPKR